MGITAGAIGCTFLVSVDAKGTDAETYPRFGTQDGLLDLFYQLVDILSSPITPLCLGKALGASILPETLIVREGHSSYGIGVEIVIHVNGIHIITGDNIMNNFANELATGGQARIEQQLLVVGDEPFGMLEVDVVRG